MSRCPCTRGSAVATLLGSNTGILSVSGGSMPGRVGDKRGSPLSRRQVLAAGAAALAGAIAPSRLLAIGRPTQVTIAMAVLPGGEAFPRPNVPRALLYELARNT